MEQFKARLLKILKNKYTWFTVAFLFFALLVIPTHGYFYDEQWWANWMNRLASQGIVNIYQDADVNYLPLYLYFLKFVSALWLTTSESRFFLAPFLKLIPLCFDLAAVALAVAIYRKAKVPVEEIAFIILNIAFLYNTLIWGQIDGIPAFFAALALWLVLNKRPLWSVAMLTLAVNFKLQAIIFVPIILIILAPQVWENRRILLKAGLLILGLETLILAPYIITGNLGYIWNVINSSVGFYPYISFNANNFWMLVKGPVNIFATDNNVIAGVVSYKNLGLTLFVATAALALWPVVKLAWNEGTAKINQEVTLNVNWLERRILAKVFMAAGLVAVAFFFFNTQMHERYLHPAILFIAIASSLDNFYLAYVLLSLGYFLNLEKIMGFLPLQNVPVILNPMLGSVLLLFALVSGFWQLYKFKAKIP